MLSDIANLRAGLSAAALLLTAACSVLPPQQHPASDEREVVVHYALSGAGSATIEVPASGRDLTVLWMDTEPVEVRESFDGGVRRFHLESANPESPDPEHRELIIRCRYRAYERPLPETGQHDLPGPEELFPGATSIETIWHRDHGPTGVRTTRTTQTPQTPAPR